MSALSSLAALPLLRDGSLSWNPSLQSSASELDPLIRQTIPEDFATAVEAEARRRLSTFADGVAAYQTAGNSVRPTEPPAIWSRGSARLLDYGATAPGAAAGLPLLCIPSLINRGYILDLTERRSLMRALAADGFRPLLMDWGTPDNEERNYSLTDYIDGHLGDALTFIEDDCGRPPAVLGYCMGGNLALALAVRRPQSVRALALLATPWDFQAGHAAAQPFLAALAPGLETMIANLGILPVDVLQALFTGLNPALTGAKFRQFADMKKDGEHARQFVALEDWLNDGVVLSGPVARECLFDWYLRNTPANGAWQVGGQIVDPAILKHPTLLMVPGDDYIVPPASAKPLGDVLPNAQLRTVKAGHIGMVAGGRAKSMLYMPLATWLKENVT
ncbi:MAG: alpha/beta fold hydrolase [Rhodospirillaceae bacterium]|nr:alpha/beta fold hydrolase [Rhodospirillaceae bacterium]